MAILAVVKLLVDLSRWLSHFGVVEGGVDISSSQNPRGESQMDSRRKQGIDEAGGVAGEDEAVAYNLVRYVRPVANDNRPRNQRRGSQSVRGE